MASSVVGPRKSSKTLHKAKLALQKGNPKHRNLNKRKRQRNIQQVKVHDKCLPNQTKEEIRGLPEKEFRRMIVKMIQNLENKMQLEINRLETRKEK